MSGPHVFAVRLKRFRQRRHPRPPHPRPTLMTLRNAPLSARDGESYRSDLGFGKTEIFLREGLDSPSHVDRLQQIGF
jgi:hypothetical protein